MQLSSLSLQFVKVPVTAVLAGQPYSPISDTVQMAFVAVGTAPASSDWKAAVWETATSGGVNTYYARCLVGPGGTVTLTTGNWSIWVKISDNPEIPVLLASSALSVI